MDAKQMQIEFERRLQLISPDLIIENKPNSETIFSFLNTATARRARDCYNEQNMDAIRTLLVEKEIFQTGLTASGLPRFRLPNTANEEYFLYINTLCKVRGTYKQYLTTTLISTDLVPYQFIDKYRETAENQKSIIRIPAVALYSDQLTKFQYLIVASDSYTTVDSVVLTYYRKPMTFNTIASANTLALCELPETEHDIVVDIAVEMFITEAKYRLATQSNPTE